MAQDTVYEGQLLTIDKRGSFAGALETIPGEVNGVKLLHAVEGMLARTFQVLQERGQSPPTRIVGGMVVSGELVNRWVGLGINPTLLILAAWPMIPCYNRENTWRYMMRSLAAAMHDDHRSKMTFQQAAQKIKKLALVMKHALAGDRQDVKLNCLDQAIDRNLYVYATEFAEKLMDEIKAGKVDPSRLLADVVADQSFLYGAVTTSLRFKPPKSQSFLFQTRTDQWYNANSEVYHHNLTRGRAFASRTKLQEIIQQTKDHVNMLGYAIRSWNAIMMEEGQPDIVFVTINEVMKMMFQPQDDCDSAAMAAAVNEMQAVMICAHCLRSYLSAQRDEFSRNWSQNVRQDEVHTIHRSIQDLLDRVIGDPPMGLGVLEYLTQTSFQPLGLEGSDVRQFETLASMENAVLEELQHRDTSKYPSLMPNDNNFPFEKVKHPGWAKIPSTQSRSSGSTNNIPGPSSEVPQDEGPKPPSYPPPGAGSSSKTRSPGSRWQLPIDPEKYGEENLKFINQDGKRMMSRFYYHKDGPSGQFFIPSYDETPSVAKGMVTSVGETYLRRVTTQLARLCSASRWSSSAGSSQMTFDLDHYVGQEDLEWLKFYQAAFHTLNLETALAYPHPIVMAALTVGGFNESFVKYEGQGGIVSVGEVRAAYNSVLSSLRPAGNTSIAAIKNEETILVIDVPLHIRIQKMYQDAETFLFKSCNWNAVRVAAPNYNAAGGWKSPNEFPKLMERAQDLLRVASPDSVATVHVVITLIATQMMPKGPEVRDHLRRTYVNPIISACRGTSRPITVVINDDARVISMGSTDQQPHRSIVRELTMILRENSNVVVIPHSTFWPKLNACMKPGCEFFIKQDEAKFALSLVDQLLIQQKITSACALENDALDAYSKLIMSSVNVEHPLLQGMDQTKQRSIRTGGVDPMAGTQAAKAKAKRGQGSDTPPWKPLELGILEPEPFYDGKTFWFIVRDHTSTNQDTTTDGKIYCCQNCMKRIDGHLGFDRGQPMRVDNDNEAWCPGCALQRCQYHFDARATWKSVDEDYRFAAACAMSLIDTHLNNQTTTAPQDGNIREYIRLCSTMRNIQEAKLVSLHGFLRVDVQHAHIYAKQGACKQVGWDEALNSGGQMCWLMCYDAGNRAYAGYLRALFTAEEMVEMVQTSDPNEELLGDIIEIAMGILMLALKYPNVFSGWMSLEQTNATLRGIERSFLTWQQSEGVEPDRNRKRRSKPKSMGQEILLKIDENKVKIPHRFTAIMEVHGDSPLEGEPEEEDIGYAMPSSSKTGARSSAPDKAAGPARVPTDDSSSSPAMPNAGDVDMDADDEMVDVELEEEDPVPMDEDLSSSSKGTSPTGNNLRAVDRVRLLLDRQDYCVLCGARDHGPSACTAVTPNDRDNLKEQLGRMSENIGKIAKERRSAKESERPAKTRKKTKPASPSQPPYGHKPKAKSRPKRCNEIRIVVHDEEDAGFHLTRRAGLNGFVIDGEYQDIRNRGFSSVDDMQNYISRMECRMIFARRGEEVPQQYVAGNGRALPYYFHLPDGVQGGDLQPIPIYGCSFGAPDWNGVTTIDSNVRINHPQRVWYSTLLRKVQMLLRHCLSTDGNDRTPIIPNDEGGWVSLETVLRLPLWNEMYHRHQDGYPQLEQDAIDQGQQLAWRYYQLMMATYVEWRNKGRVRLQFLGIRLSKPTDATAEVPGRVIDGSTISFEDQRAEIEQQYPNGNILHRIQAHCDRWVKPWAIRATCGHKCKVGYNRVIPRIESTAFKLTQDTCRAVGGAFHVTGIDNLSSIFVNGLMPGFQVFSGNARISLHFGAYAPWDTRNVSTRTRLAGRFEDPLLVIYVPAMTLLRYGACITMDGMYLTDQTIPWHEIEQMWIARPDNRSYHAFLDIEKVMGEEMRWEVVTHQNTYTFNPEHPIHNGIFITQKVIEALENMELGSRMGQARDLLAKIRESPQDHEPHIADLSIIDSVRELVEHEERFCGKFRLLNQAYATRYCPACFHATPIRLTLCIHCATSFKTIATVIEGSLRPDVDNADAARRDTTLDEDELDKIAKEAEEETKRNLPAGSGNVTDPDETADDEDMMVDRDDDQTPIHKPTAEEDAENQREEEQDVVYYTQGAAGKVYDLPAVIPGIDTTGMNADEVRSLCEDLEQKANRYMYVPVRMSLGISQAINIDQVGEVARFFDQNFGKVINQVWGALEQFHRSTYSEKLRKMNEGIRHDAVGKWLPPGGRVQVNVETGLPMDLSDDDIHESTMAKDETARTWRVRKFKMCQLCSRIVRGCLQEDVARNNFSVQVKDSDAQSIISSNVRAAIYRYLNATHYSYFRRPAEGDDFLYVDPRWIIALMSITKADHAVMSMYVMNGISLPPDMQDWYDNQVQRGGATTPLIRRLLHVHHLALTQSGYSPYEATASTSSPRRSSGTASGMPRFGRWSGSYVWDNRYNEYIHWNRYPTAAIREDWTIDPDAEPRRDTWYNR